MSERWDAGVSDILHYILTAPAVSSPSGLSVLPSLPLPSPSATGAITHRHCQRA